jgi:predicted anti-sigma-YlaC factor YlaD
MSHFSEEELIAYQLRESSKETAIQRHLEDCAECSAVSESIAETLRVFSADPVPQPDLERNWQRLRGNLTVLSPEPRRRFGFVNWRWAWPAAGLAVAAVALVAIFGVRVHKTVERPNFAVNGHGPLTTQPTDPAIANHLDAAERLLTEVNNTSGSLDDATKSQAHDLLVKNAVYVRSAHESGDLAEAAVLENLGRVLTSLDNESSTPQSTWRLRLEMNTNGLLLDIRILRQNDDRPQGPRQ